MKKDWSKYSKFWMGTNSYTFDPKNIDMSDIDTILRLSAYKKAVANFVRIATGKNIPVLYNTGVQSKTNNEVVILSAKLEENQIDPAVGVALHEASHIVKTDWQFANSMRTIIEDAWNRTFGNYKWTIDWTLLTNTIDSYKKSFGDHMWAERFRRDYVHLMTNFVEDKRIDAWQFAKSPGYRGYYSALYEKTFTTPRINKALRSKNFRRTETWESYTFRIINITNPNTDLDALKGLRKISEILDLPTISRLESTVDSFHTALKILNVVFENITTDKLKTSTPKPPPSVPKEKTPKQYREDEEDDGKDDLSDSDVDEQSGGSPEDDNLTGDDNFDEHTPQSDGTDEKDEKDENEESNDEDSDEKTDGEKSNEKSGEDGDGEKTDGEGSDEKTDGEAGGIGVDDDGEDDISLTPAQERSTERDIEKQEDFLNGLTKKKSISKDVDDMIKTCEDSDVSIERVNSGILDNRGEIIKVDCVVIRKVTHDLVKTAKFATLFENNDGSTTILQNERSISAGINLGMRLGKKLQIRNDARVTKYSRLEDGRVDKKLLASLGYGNESIFYHTEIDKFNPVMLHISVDASSSMHGEKWNKTMTTVVAICKAASMVNNLNVIVSFRSVAVKTGGSQIYMSHRSGSTALPLVAIAYDSRIDKFMKVKQLFKYIVPNSSTPEGLAFASILDEMVEGNPQKLDSYFLNFSDGEPFFGMPNGVQYSGRSAGKHTNGIIRMIRARGIKVMSYFISDHPESDSEVFKISYDKDARFINVGNLVELASTLNEMFLRKG